MFRIVLKTKEYYYVNYPIYTKEMALVLILVIHMILLDSVHGVELSRKKCAGVFTRRPCGQGAFCNPVTRYCQKCSVICDPEKATSDECSEHCPEYYQKMLHKQNHPETTSESAKVKVTHTTEGLNIKELNNSNNDSGTMIVIFSLCAVAVCVALVVLVVVIVCLMCRKGENMDPNDQPLLKKNLIQSFEDQQLQQHGDMVKKNKSSSLLAPDSEKQCESKVEVIDESNDVINCANRPSTPTTAGVIGVIISTCEQNKTPVLNQSCEQPHDSQSKESGIFSPANQSTVDVSNVDVSNSDISQAPVNNHSGDSPVNNHTNQAPLNNQPIKKATEEGNVKHVSADNPGVQRSDIVNQLPAESETRRNNFPEGDTNFQIDGFYSSHTKSEPEPKPLTFTEQPLSDVRRAGEATGPQAAPVLGAIRSKSPSRPVADDVLENINVRNYSKESGYDSVERETLLKEEPRPVNQGPPVQVVPPMQLFPPVQPHQPVQETQPLVVDDDTVKTALRRVQRGQHPNRKIYDLLKGIDWVEGYYSEGQSIEVYCDLQYISHDVAIKELVMRTGATQDKFHLLQSDAHLC